MDISLDFARMLLEADQLARGGRLQEAQVVYGALAGLGELGPEEQALADVRLAAVSAALGEGSALQVVERSAADELQSDGARAEALANDGDLAGAVAVYEQIVHTDPDNSLAIERLTELRASLAASQPVAPAAVAPPAAPEPAPIAVEAVAETAAAAVREVVGTIAGGADWRIGLPEDPVAMLELLLERLQANRRAQA